MGVAKSRAVVETAVSGTIKLRDEVQEMGHLLLEMAEVAARNDTQGMTEILTELKQSTEQAFVYTEGYRSQCDGLLKETQAQHKEFSVKKDKSASKSKTCGLGSLTTGTMAVTGSVGGGYAAAIGAGAAVNIPVVGSMLTSSVTSTVVVPLQGWFGTIFGATATMTTTTVSFSPAACCLLGSGSFVLGVAAIYFLKKVHDYKTAKSIAGELQEHAEDMVRLAEQNKEFWRGLMLAADGVKSAMGKLEGMSVSRRSAFNRRMCDSGKKLLLLKEALDEYIVWMSLCQYYPKNYNTRALIGSSNMIR